MAVRRESDVAATSHQPPGAASWVGRSRSHAAGAHSQLRCTVSELAAGQREAAVREADQPQKADESA